MDDAAAEEVIFFVEDIYFDNDLDFNDFDFSSDFNDHDNDTAAAATLSGSKAKRQTL